jgi:hypothetical protein
MQPTAEDLQQIEIDFENAVEFVQFMNENDIE